MLVMGISVLGLSLSEMNRNLVLSDDAAVHCSFHITHEKMKGFSNEGILS